MQCRKKSLLRRKFLSIYFLMTKLALNRTDPRDPIDMLQRFVPTRMRQDFRMRWGLPQRNCGENMTTSVEVKILRAWRSVPGGKLEKVWFVSVEGASQCCSQRSG